MSGPRSFWGLYDGLEDKLRAVGAPVTPGLQTGSIATTAPDPPSVPPEETKVVIHLNPPEPIVDLEAPEQKIEPPTKKRKTEAPPLVPRSRI